MSTRRERRERRARGARSDRTPGVRAAHRTLRHGGPSSAAGAADEIDRAFAELARIVSDIQRQRCSGADRGVEPLPPPW